MDEEFEAKRQRVLSLLERADMPDDIKERYLRLTMHSSEWSELKEVLVGDLDLRGDLVEPRVALRLPGGFGLSVRPHRSPLRATRCDLRSGDPAGAEGVPQSARVRAQVGDDVTIGHENLSLRIESSILHFGQPFLDGAMIPLYVRNKGNVEMTLSDGVLELHNARFDLFDGAVANW